MQKQTVSFVATLVLITLIVGVTIGQAQSVTTITYLSAGSMSTGYNYVFFKDGTNFFVRNCLNGRVTGNSNASYLLTATLNTLATNGGGSIWLKHGVYDLDAPIIFPPTITEDNSRTRLELIGDGAVLSFDAAITDDLLQVDNSAHLTTYYSIKLRGFEVWQQSQDENYYCLVMTDTFYCYLEDMVFGWGGVKLDNATDSYMSNVAVVDSPNEGLNFLQTQYLMMDNIWLDNCGGWGATGNYVGWLITSCTRIYATNMNIFGEKATGGGQGAGIYIYDSSNIHFSNFEIDGFKDTPLTIAGEHGLYFDNFNIKGSDASCILVSPTAEDILDISFTNFRLNIDNANQHGISIYAQSTYDVNRVMVSNGIIIGSSGNEIGINLNDDGTGTVGNVTIEQVTMYDMNYAINEASNSDYNMISGVNALDVYNGILIDGTNTKVSFSWNYTNWIS